MQQNSYIAVQTLSAFGVSEPEPALPEQRSWLWLWLIGIAVVIGSGAFWLRNRSR